QQIAFRGDLFGRLDGATPAAEIISLSGPPVTGTRPDQELQNPAGRLPENFTGAFRSGPFDAFSNPGTFFARRVAATLDASNIPSIVYVSALNHSLLGELANDDLFHANLAMIDELFRGHHFAFNDYEAALTPDELFADTEHLTL